jgi:phage N-6-adenine-methyltransferase
VATGKQDWTTPQWLFDVLNEEFGYTVDLFAGWYNAKLPNFFGPGSLLANDAFSVSWKGYRGWANPPYNMIERCLRHAISEASEGVFSTWLLPANTDTKWFYEFARHGQIDFFKGRISFEDHTPAEVEATRLFDIVEAYSSPNAPGFKKALQGLGKVLREIAMKTGGLEPVPEQSPLAVALRKLDKYLPEWRDFNPEGRRKPGPGFPSMLVHFDPELLGKEAKAFRMRDAKTGLLL